MGSRMSSNSSTVTALVNGAAKVYAEASADQGDKKKFIKIIQKLQKEEEQEKSDAPYISTSSAHKRFRNRIYDVHDMIYANKLSNIYYINHTQATKEKFNLFSEYLMDEPAIKKDRMIYAIEEYKKTFDNIKYPLSLFFVSAALNFKPYNS
jgi:hypothetical protein